MANTIKLQGIYGHHEGTATKDLKIGDVIVWNYGYKSEVVEIIPSKTGKTITFMLKSFENGNISPRKMGAERLVVVEKKQEAEPTNHESDLRYYLEQQIIANEINKEHAKLA